MFPEQTRTCGLRRNSSSLDKAPKMRELLRLNSWERLNWFFDFVTKMPISSIMRENRFQQKQTVNDVKFSTIPKGYNLYNNNSTFVSSIYNFSLARNVIVYTPIQGTHREKYLSHIIYKGKLPTLAGNKHLSVHFSFHRPCLLHFST